MALLVQLLGVQRAIEIGTFTGYSTLCVALAMLEQGEIIACDINPNDTAIAQEFWQQAGIDHKITLKIAPALTTLDRLLTEGRADEFDCAFIDADKKNYINYSLYLKRLVRQIADDTKLLVGGHCSPYSLLYLLSEVRAVFRLLP